jgi:hypothetical protein
MGFKMYKSSVKPSPRMAQGTGKESSSFTSESLADSQLSPKTPTVLPPNSVLLISNTSPLPHLKKSTSE